MFGFLGDAVASFWSDDGPESPAATTAAVPAPAFLTPDPASAGLPGEARPAAKKPGTPPDPAEVRSTATEIFNAIDGMTEDEDAVLGTLRGKSPEEISAIRDQYFKLPLTF